MTLAVRLGVLFTIGFIAALLCNFLLWPTHDKLALDATSTARPTPTDLAGVYHMKKGASEYRLEISSENVAVLEYQDKKKKRFGYRGKVEATQIVWEAQRQGKKWAVLKQPVVDPIQVPSAGQLVLQEGLFSRK